MNKKASNSTKKLTEWDDKATYIRNFYKKLECKVRNRLLADINYKFGLSPNTLWQKFEGRRNFLPIQVDSIYRFIKNNENKYLELNNELTRVIKQCNGAN